MNTKLTKNQTLILLFVFLAIGGLVLYKDTNKNNFTPFKNETLR